MIRRLSSALRAGLSRLDLREQRLQRIRRKMRAVRRCRRESAQRVGDFRGCDCRRVLERGAAKPLREPRSTSNRRGAAAAQKTCFPDSPALDYGEKMQPISADRIRGLDFRSGVGQLTHVTRMAKMIKNRF